MWGIGGAILACIAWYFMYYKKKEGATEGRIEKEHGGGRPEPRPLNPKA